MASHWQIRANQRSAQRSTGPRTPEGREAAKRNSTRHGLTGKGIVLPEEMADEVNARYNEFRSQWRPFDAYDDWLTEVGTTESVKADCAQRHLIALKTDQSQRAATRWQADRMIEAERIAEKLIKSPGRVVRELKGFLQGAQWLILRWEGLIHVVEATGTVEDAQRQTALDLLGVPFDVRAAATPLDAPGRGPAEVFAEVGRAEIAALEVEIDEDLTDRDETERSRAELGFGTPTHEMKLMQRYLNSALRRHEWAKDRINKGGQNYQPPIHPANRPEPGFIPLAQREEPLWDPYRRGMARPATAASAEYIRVHGEGGVVPPAAPAEPAPLDPPPASLEAPPDPIAPPTPPHDPPDPPPPA